MKINCVWEHNGNDSLLYAADLPGAFSRGRTREEALSKMEREVFAFLRWMGEPVPDSVEIEIIQDKASELAICDADSDVLFVSEEKPLAEGEYRKLRELALKSARDFQRLYDAVPDKSRSALPLRRTFYGPVPGTAEEMYSHTRSVNAYYFAEIDVDADSEGTIARCRERGFARLEQQPDFLTRGAAEGSYGESWSLRKVLRRFIWHDRIHAKAMYRMAKRVFGEGSIPDVFCFDTE